MHCCVTWSVSRRRSVCSSAWLAAHCRYVVCAFQKVRTGTAERESQGLEKWGSHRPERKGVHAFCSRAPSRRARAGLLPSRRSPCHTAGSAATNTWTNNMAKVYARASGETVSLRNTAGQAEGCLRREEGNDVGEREPVCVRACVHAYVCACVCVRARARLRACVRVCVCMCASAGSGGVSGPRA
eukprot:2347322-Pleurochrysis_carterae.AAC.1